ncbi:hypothetical protein EHYA_09625 [Embleya hyalina]|uniref:Uncharacterized protein n=1 Tax=Embleya hyalina TaxID=516124 RepID=A0A401Z4S2_9ACTN|nr:hypothetical protein EHYA_09625 [Embleya hyalina]
MNRGAAVDRSVERVHQGARRKVLLTWPQEIDARLDLLVRAATEAGERTNRSELLAALIASTKTTPKKLADTLRAYRRLDPETFTAAHDRPDLPTVRRTGPKTASGDTTAPTP